MSDAQFDWVGNRGPEKRLRQHGNTRPTVAEEKARLSLMLAGLCLNPPKDVVSGYVQTVRLWKSRQEAAMKILKSARASVVDLERAIKSFGA